MRKNKLFLLLALLLTAATGAWAQDVTMKEITGSDIQSSWNGNTDPVKATDLPGFKAVTRDEAIALGAPSNNEKVYLIYAINASNKFAALIYESGTKSSSETDFNLKQLQSAAQNYWVYYTYSDAPASSTYTVSLKDGVKDADKWSIEPKEGLSEGDKVTLTYNGRLKVKGVKATSDEAVLKTPATVTTAPTGAAIVGVGKTTALVSGGVADGGTLMYRVTTENTKPASTDGFSDAVPTAKDITASGKVYVWYYVKGDDTHSDSEIAATAIEVPVADIVWDATNVSNLGISGTNATYEKEGVTLSTKADRIRAGWEDVGDPTYDGITFYARETGGYTFTAPTGKAFTRIEMKPIGPGGWYDAYEEAILGTGWALDIDYENAIITVTWMGGAASTVGLLTDADKFSGHNVKYIAFYLSE